SLKETIGSNSATVSNAKYNFSLTRVDNQWRIAATPELVDQIVYPDKADEAIRMEWAKVEQEYDARTAMLQNLIGYLKANNKNTNEVAQLEKALKQLPHHISVNKKAVSAYMQKQKEISTLAD